MKRIYRLSWLIILLLVLTLSGNAFAALTHTATATPLSLDVTWNWNPEENDSESFVVPDGSPYLWIAGLSLAYSPVFERWDGVWSAQHIVNPHEGEEIPVWSDRNFQFGTNATGLVWSENFSVIHPGPEGHSDNYTFSFYRGATPETNLIHLTGEHNVPIPGAVWLLGSGLLGLIGLRKKFKG